MTQTAHLDFDNNESTDQTMTVQGTEVMDTAVGRLTVWRCVEEHMASDGTRYIATYWFAPQLGMPVKTTATLTSVWHSPPFGMPSLATGTPTTMPTRLDDLKAVVTTIESEITKTNVPLEPLPPASSPRLIQWLIPGAG